MRGRAPASALGSLLVVLASAAAATTAAAQANGPRPERRAFVSDDFAAILREGEIVVEARPLEGETPIAFARRLARDESIAQRILGAGGGPSRTSRVLVSWGGLSDETRRAAIVALFPSDVRGPEAWLHAPIDDEPLASIADWFTGSPANAAAIGAASQIPGPTAARGVVVTIPASLLLPPFRDAPPVAADEARPPKLEFGRDADGRYALYRLKPKEALYSAVVVRFTGRLFAEDVIELALRIAERSGIEDVHAIPIGYPVKIPIDLLAPEWLPKDDPRSQDEARGRAEAAQFAAPAPAADLAGIRIVLDAGHGGRDTGTIHGGIWESTYVYDVANRLRKLLRERTRAEVVMTTSEPGVEWGVPERDVLPNRKGRLLLTEPRYPLFDPTVGVNLRWYLANAILRRPGPERRKVPPARTVFLSIHADSLHPSVRGAMAYVPGERFLRDRYGKRREPYDGYREWREEPVVSFSKRERVESEGASTTLAAKILEALRRRDLPIHRFSPVRTHVIRGGREWVPAVLRYNRIPNRVLLEIANLGNEEDRGLVTSRAFRQSVADGIAAGLLDFFGRDAEDRPAGREAARRASPPARDRAEKASVAVEPVTVSGPWPAVEGPWPRTIGPDRPLPGPSVPSRR